MISKELELALQHSFVNARRERHEFITVEHLLAALLDSPSAGDALRACGANLDSLRDKLKAHIGSHTPHVSDDHEVDTQPALGFQRTIQRAILHAQSAGTKEVTGADVLVAIFAGKDSHAAYFLQQQGIERLNITEHIPHRAVDGETAPVLVTETLQDVVLDSRQILLFKAGDVPVELLARVLEDFLLMNLEDVAEVVNDFNAQQKAVCGLFPRDAAEVIAEQIGAYARKHGLPLRCETAIQKLRP